MNKEQKTHSIAKFSKELESSKMTLIFDFKGLKVKEATLLRKNLKKTKSQMKVIKNTLAKRALQNEPQMATHFSSDLKGTNAFILAYEEASQTLKELTQFKREDESPLQIKKAYLKGYGALDQAQLKKWANLPSKETLQAQFLSLLQNQGISFLNTLQAVPLNFLRLLTAYKSQKEKNEVK